MYALFFPQQTSGFFLIFLQHFLDFLRSCCANTELLVRTRKRFPWPRLFYQHGVVVPTRSCFPWTKLLLQHGVSPRLLQLLILRLNTIRLMKSNPRKTRSVINHSSTQTTFTVDVRASLFIEDEEQLQAPPLKAFLLPFLIVFLVIVKIIFLSLYKTVA